MTDAPCIPRYQSAEPCPCEHCGAELAADAWHAIDQATSWLQPDGTVRAAEALELLRFCSPSCADDYLLTFLDAYGLDSLPDPGDARIAPCACCGKAFDRARPHGELLTLAVAEMRAGDYSLGEAETFAHVCPDCMFSLDGGFDGGGEPLPVPLAA